jgi:uncharacterized BrkB/YihY/UPF0761 family membrane protein
MYDRDLWLSIFHIFTFAILVYALIHRVWNYSKTTVIVIAGFQVFGVLVQFAPVAFTVAFLIIFMMYLYYRAVTKAKKTWSKYEYELKDA